MPVNITVYNNLVQQLTAAHATLVAVSKLQPVTAIEELYHAGQRDFGENYVQELLEKKPQLPPDVRWHFIGHLQSNKVKYILPFVWLIHGVDSEKLLTAINKQAAKINRPVQVLLQMHIAEEATKFGFDENELQALAKKIAGGTLPLSHTTICGLMGMATFTNDESLIRREFESLQSAYKNLQQLMPGIHTLSMGMSGDYAIALQHGSNMVRVGSLLFGARNT